MKRLSSDELNLVLSDAQKRNLLSYQRMIGSDHTGRVFDGKAVEYLKTHLQPGKMSFVNKVLGYLKDLKDPSGLPFARSEGTVASMMEQLHNFEKPDVPTMRWRHTFKRAMDIVEQRYKPLSFKPLDYKSDADVLEAVTDWNTSAGWLRILNGPGKKNKYIPNILTTYSKWETKALADGSFNQPIILHVRTQGQDAFDKDGNPTGTCKLKERAVNIVSLPVILAESKWGAPLTYNLKGYSYSAIGFRDEQINNWVNARRSEFPWFVSLDYSKYDSTIPAWLIRAAFDILADISNHEQEALLRVVEEDFIYKNMITPYGILYAKHGNPSGSRLTAIVNGICNELITETWMQAFHVHGKYMIMGDDNLIFMDRDSAQLVDQIASYIKYNFGIKVNSDKSNIGTNADDPEFMSRVWTMNAVKRSPEDIISLIAYPEKPRDYDSNHSPLTPAILVFSYILSYSWNMSQLVDMSSIRGDLPKNLADIVMSSQVRSELPYSVRTYVEASNRFRLNKKQWTLSQKEAYYSK